MSYRIVFIIMIAIIPIVNLIVALLSNISLNHGGTNKKGKITSYGIITPSARQSVNAKIYADRYARKLFTFSGLAELVICIVLAIVTLAKQIGAETLVTAITYIIVIEALILVVLIFVVELFTWKKFDGEENTGDNE